MLHMTTAAGHDIPLEEPCSKCSGTGVIIRGGGSLTGRCGECGGTKLRLTDSARAILELVARYGQLGAR
jgi:DnaJ-class molecular chaperone